MLKPEIDKILKGICLKIIMNKRVKSKISCYNFLPENHRGQVTIFIIIAIILIVAVAFYFVLKDKADTDEPIYIESAQVYNFVQECLETTSKQSLYFIGLHGGYFIPPEKSTAYGVPYYIYLGDYLFPHINKIEEEISIFVESSLTLCTEDFEDFGSVVINQSEVRAITSVEGEFVSIKVNYPITIQKGESVSRIEDFEVEIPVRLSVLYNASKFILDSHFENSGELCLSCLLEFQKENSLQINMQSNEETIVYEIVDTLSTLEIIKDEFEPENYKFRFAIKY